MSGDSWFSGVGRRLFNNGHFDATLILIIYFCFTSMGILNIVTGIFVEQTVAAAQMDAEVVKERLMEEQVAALKLIFSSFNEADEDGNELLSAEEFGSMMQMDGIMDRFNQLDIKPRDAIPPAY